MRRLAMLPLEKMSDPMQGLYADLRHQYPRAAINLKPEEGLIQLVFTAGPTILVKETATGMFRVRASREVPAGKRSKRVEQAKTAKDARAVLYAIDGFLVEGPRVAQAVAWERTLQHTVRSFRTLVASLQADAPAAYEQIAHMFMDSLGSSPEQLSSCQLGDRLSQFIRGDLRRHWKADSLTPEMWQDVGRLLEEHGIHMDVKDFNAAIDRKS